MTRNAREQQIKNDRAEKQAAIIDGQMVVAEKLIHDIPGVTIGYIGNTYIDGTDDRSWFIFLPHLGRAGGREDRIGGYPTHQRGRLLGAARALAAGFEIGAAS